MTQLRITAKPSAYTSKIVSDYYSLYAASDKDSPSDAMRRNHILYPKEPYARFDIFMSTIHPTWKHMKGTDLPDFNSLNFPHEEVKKFMLSMIYRKEEEVFIKLKNGAHVSWGK